MYLVIPIEYRSDDYDELPDLGLVEINKENMDEYRRKMSPDNWQKHKDISGDIMSVVYHVSEVEWRSDDEWELDAEGVYMSEDKVGRPFEGNIDLAKFIVTGHFAYYKLYGWENGFVDSVTFDLSDLEELKWK